MKKFLILTALFLGAALMFAQEVSVREVAGRVEVQPHGEGWSAVEKGDVIPVSATISTGFQSRAVLVTPRATIVVQPLTRMTIDQLQDDGRSNATSLSLRTGRITAAVKKNDAQPTRFQVKSPIATAAVRGTEFSFNGYQLTVEEGLVAFSSDGGRVVTVPMGGSSEMLADGIPQEVIDAVIQQVLTVNPADVIDSIIPLLEELEFINIDIDDLIVTVQ